MPLFRTAQTPLQIVQPNYRTPLAGIVTTAMTLGALVEVKHSVVGDPLELVAANGGRPAFLENPVLLDVDWQAYGKLDPQWLSDIRKPVPVGSGVSARFAHVVEVEGATLFTGIDANTAAGTPLKTAAGKFAIATVAIPSGGGTADRVIGYLTRLVPPADSTSFRWVIELIA